MLPLRRCKGGEDSGGSAVIARAAIAVAYFSTPSSKREIIVWHFEDLNDICIKFRAPAVKHTHTPASTYKRTRATVMKVLNIVL